MPRRNPDRPNRQDRSGHLCKMFGQPVPTALFPPPLGQPRYSTDDPRGARRGSRVTR